MKGINLKYTDKITLVDDADFDFLSKWEWFLSLKGRAVRLELVNFKTSCIYLHREVLNLKPGDGLIVHHIDLDKLNNTKENLKILSSHEHAKFHSIERWKDRDKMIKTMVGVSVGVKNPNSKLTWEIAREIRTLYKTGNFSIYDLGKKFNVSPSGCIFPLVQNRTWKE